MNGEPIGNTNYGRVSKHINRVPAVNIHHATRFSERIGLPLNTFVTISLSNTPEPRAASRIFRKLLCERFSPWLRRSAGSSTPPTYVWTIEQTRGVTAAHWLVHVPKGIGTKLGRKLEAWLGSLTGEEAASGDIQMKPIYNLVGVRRYVLKGVNPVWAERLGIRAVDQGIVNGKRSGFSKNLGPTARRAGGYVPRRRPPV